MNAITVVIADDHPVMRDAVVSLLTQQADIEVVGWVDNGSDAIERCRAFGPRVAVVDLSMPGIGGFDAIRGIRAVSPDTRVLVLSMYDDQPHVRAALAAGAAGYVVKSAAGSELLDAIRTIDAGRSHIRVSLDADGGARGLVDTPRIDLGRDPHDVLSQRELEVLALVALGYTDKEVAAGLGVAAKSVGTYRARVRDKLGLTGRASMVRCALRYGLLPDV